MYLYKFRKPSRGSRSRQFVNGGQVIDVPKDQRDIMFEAAETPPTIRDLDAHGSVLMESEILMCDVSEVPIEQDRLVAPFDDVADHPVDVSKADATVNPADQGFA